MIVDFTIGALPGQNPIADYIQDSRFGDCEMVYWLINGQPNYDFTQDMETRRVTWNQSFNSGDYIICHLKN